MPAENFIMGLFRDEDRAVDAARSIKQSAFRLHQFYSPVPSHKVETALKMKPSRVGYFTLAGGIIGFFTGFLLAIYSATQWHIIVSGKPIVALIPFFIVGFEFTILFAVFGNVIGMLVLTGLPRYDQLDYHDSRCSGEHFGVLASCKSSQREQLVNFFRNHGGDIRIFE